MGIINVTPDSFSDGGQCMAPEVAIRHGMEMASQGADILDVGGESTRPGAQAVDVAEELRRVLPVIGGLARAVGIPISIDTRHHEVAEAALAAGASIVNDIEAGRRGPEMWRAVRDAGAGYICMHMQGTPETMQSSPVYGDVVAEVRAFLAERLAALAEFGIEPARIAIDPGIGFGKDLAHNLALLRGLDEFVSLGHPVVLGVSRKGFVGTVTGAARPSERLAGGLACALHAARSGVAILRTHDVAPTVQALRMWAALERPEGAA
jgi:dihydropteroate synthase